MMPSSVTYYVLRYYRNELSYSKERNELMILNTCVSLLLIYTRKHIFNPLLTEYHSHNYINLIIQEIIETLYKNKKELPVNYNKRFYLNAQHYD